MPGPSTHLVNNKNSKIRPRHDLATRWLALGRRYQQPLGAQTAGVPRPVPASITGSALNPLARTSGTSGCINSKLHRIRLGRERTMSGDRVESRAF